MKSSIYTVNAMTKNLNMNEQHIPGSFGGDASKIADNTRLECKICWYIYDPEKGDDYWQIPLAPLFQNCPNIGAVLSVMAKK